MENHLTRSRILNGVIYIIGLHSSISCLLCLLIIEVGVIWSRGSLAAVVSVVELVLPIGVVVIGVAIVAVFVPGNIRVAEGKSGGVAGSQASSKDHDAPNRNQGWMLLQ